MNIKDLLKDKSTKVLCNWMGWFEGATGTKHIGGIYRSDDPRTIQNQVKMMKAVGIDGVVCDWYGYNPDFSPPSNPSTIAMMLECERQGLEFSIMLDGGIIKWPEVGDKQAKLNEAVQYCRENFFTSPAYPKLNGKPLMWEFDLREAGIDMSAFAKANPDLFIAYKDKLPPTVASDNSGRYGWVNGFPDNPGGYLQWYFQQPAVAFDVPCAFFQFDDHSIKDATKSAWDGPARYIGPRNGETWSKCFDFINQSGRNFQYVQICTWNDYEERTAIEPFARAGTGMKLW